MTKKEIKQPQFKIIEDSKDEPNLKEAQKFVGGYVEGITFPNGDYLIINEEGKIMGLPLNEQASKLCNTTCSSGTPLYKKGGWATTYN